jgi:hypothetical protein
MSGSQRLNNPPASVPIAVLAISIKSKYDFIITDWHHSQKNPIDTPITADTKGTPIIFPSNVNSEKSVMLPIKYIIANPIKM